MKNPMSRSRRASVLRRGAAGIAAAALITTLGAAGATATTVDGEEEGQEGVESPSAGPVDEADEVDEDIVQDDQSTPEDDSAEEGSGDSDAGLFQLEDASWDTVMLSSANGYQETTFNWGLETEAVGDPELVDDGYLQEFTATVTQEEVVADVVDFTAQWRVEVSNLSEPVDVDIVVVINDDFECYVYSGPISNGDVLRNDSDHSCDVPTDVFGELDNGEFGYETRVMEVRVDDEVQASTGSRWGAVTRNPINNRNVTLEADFAGTAPSLDERTFTYNEDEGERFEHEPFTYSVLLDGVPGQTIPTAASLMSTSEDASVATDTVNILLQDAATTANQGTIEAAQTTTYGWAIDKTSVDISGNDDGYTLDYELTVDQTTTYDDVELTIPATWQVENAGLAVDAEVVAVVNDEHEVVIDEGQYVPGETYSGEANITVPAETAVEDVTVDVIVRSSADETTLAASGQQTVAVEATAINQVVSVYDDMANADGAPEVLAEEIDGAHLEEPIVLE